MKRELLPWHHPNWNRFQQTRAQGRLPHALLMSGKKGLGKARFARQLAESLLCEQPDSTGQACGLCRSCQLLEADNHPDLRLVMPEEGKTQISIDAIRELVAGNTLSVGDQGYRAFIIDPADSMGHAAANALLKTLEEPIEGTLILLLCDRIDRLPVTIRSRCQLMPFAVPDDEQAKEWLIRNCDVSAEQVSDWLALANGAPLRVPELVENDALKHYEQLLDNFLAIAQGRASAAQVGEAWLKEYQLSRLLSYITGWLGAVIRQGMCTQAFGAASPGFQNLSERLDLKLVYRLLDRLHEIERMSTHNLNPQLALESILLQWADIAKGER